MTDRPPHPNADVRMKGFTERATVEQALAWIDGVLPAFGKLPRETVSIEQAFGRVAANDVASAVDVPRFARAMMDGFAVVAEDSQGASAYNPLPLQIVGQAMPGRGFDGTVARGQAVRIMTGAPIPTGATAVLPAEWAHDRTDVVEALADVSTGKHIGQIGEDVVAGDIAVPAQRRLRPQDIGILSAIGRSEIEVVRAPQVSLLITGSEILSPGAAPQGHKFADANGPMLASLVERDGGQVSRRHYVADDRDAIASRLDEPADIILVSGGSSVGIEDFVPQLLAERSELAIHGIAMRPSSPAGMGRWNKAIVFLLPGNPVSCLCAYEFFAGRAIRALAGRDRNWPHPQRRLRLRRKLSSMVGRVDFARVKTEGDEAEPIAIGGAAVLSSTTRADGFVIVPADSEGYPAGAEVDVLLFDAF